MPRKKGRAPAPFDIAPERGVFIGKFIENGHRWVWSVDSKGHQVRLRTVYVGEATGMTDELHATVAELETQLDTQDPTRSFSPAPLRLTLL